MVLFSIEDWKKHFIHILKQNAKQILKGKKSKCYVILLILCLSQQNGYTESILNDNFYRSELDTTSITRS